MSAGSTPEDRPITWIAPLLIGVLGVLAACALPFAPVWISQTTVRWPVRGTPAASSTAFFVPYRPSALTASAPCPVLRAAAARGTPTTVLATATGGAGLQLRVSGGQVQVLMNGRQVATSAVGPAHCHIRVDAGSSGVTVVTQDGTLSWKHEPTPRIQLFRTDLDPAQARGLTITARTSAVFDTPPSALKKALIGGWALAALLSLVLLRPRRHRPERADPGAPGGGPAGAARWWARVRGAAGPLDVGVVLVLAGWAVIGPLSDDDGFAAMIARNSGAAGYQGNYYRWWNASETPFALAQHVLVPLTRFSLSPLWLRLPSTGLAVGTWLVISRALLPVVLPDDHHRRWVRALAGCAFLACWLPFDLGVRPESYVAFGVTAVLALLWRGRTRWALAAALLVAGVVATSSPAAVILAGPLLAFAGPAVRLLREGTTRRREVAGRVAALACLAAVTVVLVFADQSWFAVSVATRWHTGFGPSMSWFQEYARYQYLLGDDQDGTATKRLPVLLTLALLPVAGFALAARAGCGDAARRLREPAGRVAWVSVLCLLLLWPTPSKWSHYFGALAGVSAVFLTVAVVLLVRCAADAGDRTGFAVRLGLAGAGAVALLAGIAFSGPNAWWQPAVYDVPWAAGPIRPAGLPLDSPLLWAGLAGAGYLVVRHRHGTGAARRALVAAPGLLAATALVASVAVLLVSFVAAPLRQPSGSLALSNLRRLAGTPTCGLGDDVQVLPDVPGSVMAPAPGSTGTATGFRYLGGFDPAAPPPDRPGTGASAQLWGSLDGGPENTGALVTPWFVLPPVPANDEIAVSVAGRTDGGNALTLEFGRSGPAGAVPTPGPQAPSSVPTSDPHAPSSVTSLGGRPPLDPLPSAPGTPPDHRLWRAVGVPASAIPAGADRVRLRATDASSGPDGWLAVTGPRLREVTSLRAYLPAHGPVLVAWPQAFLFPCAVDTVAVRDGVAQAPALVIEAPRRYAGLSSVSSDPGSGGDFAPLRDIGGLGEVTTRLAGRPSADWGDLLVAGYPLVRDGYQLRTTRRLLPGTARHNVTRPDPPDPG